MGGFGFLVIEAIGYQIVVGLDKRRNMALLVLSVLISFGGPLPVNLLFFRCSIIDTGFIFIRATKVNCPWCQFSMLEYHICLISTPVMLVLLQTVTLSSIKGAGRVVY